MLKTLRTVFDSICCVLFALYLGDVFSGVFLKAFIPDAFRAGGVLLSGVGFCFVLRWLKAETAPQAERLKTENFLIAPSATAPSATAPSATAPSGPIIWEALSSASRLLENRAMSELTALLQQSRRHSEAQEKRIESIVAHVSAKSENRTGTNEYFTPI